MDRPLIFLSYAHSDAEQVLPDVDLLEASGLSVWYDRSIPAGAEWREYIARRVSGAEVIVAYLSDAWIASEYCRQEVTFALDMGKRVVPVMLGDVELPLGLRMSLGGRQWVDRPRGTSAASPEFVSAVRLAAGLEVEAEEEPATRAIPAVLRLRCGDDQLTLHSSQTGRYIIGRGADCNFRLRSDFVSRHHGYVHATGGGFAFGDTSKNGTMLVHPEGESLIHQRQIVLPQTGVLRFADQEVSFQLEMSMEDQDHR